MDEDDCDGVDVGVAAIVEASEESALVLDTPTEPDEEEELGEVNVGAGTVEEEESTDEGLDDMIRKGR